MLLYLNKSWLLAIKGVLQDVAVLVTPAGGIYGLTAVHRLRRISRKHRGGRGQGLHAGVSRKRACCREKVLFSSLLSAWLSPRNPETGELTAPQGPSKTLGWLREHLGTSRGQGPARRQEKSPIALSHMNLRLCVKKKKIILKPRKKLAGAWLGGAEAAFATLHEAGTAEEEMLWK